MTEQDILNLIKEDKWMMEILHRAEEQNLKNWYIGAGFIRNKVWDYLHGFSKAQVDTSDIDLVYFDKDGNDENADKKLSRKLNLETGLVWEVVNELYAHKWNNLPPYESIEDAISQWPETVTAIGVTLKNGELKLMCPYGVDDLVNLIIRPSPKFSGGISVVKERAEKKKWLEKWPKLIFEE